MWHCGASGCGQNKATGYHGVCERFARQESTILDKKSMIFFLLSERCQVDDKEEVHQYIHDKHPRATLCLYSNARHGPRYSDYPSKDTFKDRLKILRSWMAYLI